MGSWLGSRRAGTIVRDLMQPAFAVWGGAWRGDPGYAADSPAARLFGERAAILSRRPLGTPRTHAVLRSGGIFRGLNVPSRTSRRDTIDAPLSNADYYREKAQEIRSLAWRSRSVEVRLALRDC